LPHVQCPFGWSARSHGAVTDQNDPPRWSNFTALGQFSQVYGGLTGLSITELRHNDYWMQIFR